MDSRRRETDARISTSACWAIAREALVEITREASRVSARRDSSCLVKADTARVSVILQEKKEKNYKIKNCSKKKIV